MILEELVTTTSVHCKWLMKYKIQVCALKVFDIFDKGNKK